MFICNIITVCNIISVSNHVNNYELVILISVLKVRKFKFRNFTLFAQGHTVSKWRSWNTMSAPIPCS